MLLFGFDLAHFASRLPTLDAGDLATVLGTRSVRFLGSGSFGESWAFDHAGTTRVAKVLTDTAFATSKYVIREVQGLARANGPHVVRLLEIQVLTLPVGGRLTLMFEFIDGGDVMSRLLGGHWPTEAEVERFALASLRGLVALHEQEVVHRDIKPENIALRDGDWGGAVLLDLGLGRLLDTSTLTPYPAAVGTAPYMAPEVIEGRPARKSSDLWSLGIVLHLLLTRGHPFFPDPTEVLDASDALDRLNAGPPDLPSTVPDPLRVLVRQFLAPVPYERGSSSRALRELEGGHDRTA